MKNFIFVVSLLSFLLPTSIADNCCPLQRTANSDQFLQLQQTFGTLILCTYGRGPNFKQCLYAVPSGYCLTANNSCADTSAPETFATPICPPTSVLYSNHDPNKCIEVKDANYAVGTPVQVNQCNGENHQRFIFTVDYDRAYKTFIRVAGTDLCVAAGNIAVGSPVTLKKCDSTISEQIWIYDVWGHRFYLNATFRTVPNLVLSLPNVENEQQLTIQVFDHLDHKQVFHLDSHET